MKSPSFPSSNCRAESVLHRTLTHAFFFSSDTPLSEFYNFIETFGIWLGKYPRPSQLLLFFKYVLFRSVLDVLVHLCFQVYFAIHSSCTKKKRKRKTKILLIHRSIWVICHLFLYYIFHSMNIIYFLHYFHSMMASCKKVSWLSP